MDNSNISSANYSQNEVLEFKNSRKVGGLIAAALGFAFLMIALIVFNLFLMFVSNKPHTMMPGLMGGMAVIPIMCIGAAIYLARTPVRVLIGSNGLTVEWLIRCKVFSWNNIAEIQFSPPSQASIWFDSAFHKQKTNSQECAVLLDSNGRKLVVLPSNMEQFNVLVKEIHGRIAALKGDSVFDADKQLGREIQKRKKSRVLMLVIGIIFPALGITFMIISLNDYRNARQLEKDGVTIDAAVTKHYIYNVTPRTKYEFTASNGKSYSNDVMVDKDSWYDIKEKGTVSVKYVPSNPNNSRLINGQIDANDMPLPLAMVCAVAMTAMGCGGLAMYFLHISDIKFTNGRFKIIRIYDAQLSPSAAILVGGAPALEAKVSQLILDVPKQPPSGQKLPAGLKAIGILNIVFGSIGLLWNIGKIVFLLLIVAGMFKKLELLDTKGVSLLLVGHGLSAALSLLFIISGIGVLGLWSWGRLMGIVAGYGKLAFGVITIMTTTLTTEQMADQQQQFVYNLTKVFSVIFILLAMVYPVVAVILLQRHSTRQLFCPLDHKSQE